MLNKEKLPYDLREKISDMFFTRIDTGESGAKVFKVSSDTASYYLKIETAAGELEERHFVGGRRVRDEVVRRTRNRRFQGVFALIAAQQYKAYRAMRIHKGVEEIIAREQRVIAIGNQHGGFDLHSVGVQFAALMAKERVDRRDADLQQREEGHVELGHVAKLHQRKSTGRGGLVEANLFSSGFALLGPFAQSTLLTGRSPKLVGNANPFISPFGRFLCDQGSYLMLTIGSDQQFTTLCRLLGVEEHVAHEFADHHVRLDRAQELNALLQGAFSRLAAQEWEEILGSRGIACSSVNSVAQALDHPQVEPLGLIQRDRLGHHQIASPVFLDGAPLCALSPAPMSEEAMNPKDAFSWFVAQPTPNAVHF